MTRQSPGHRALAAIRKKDSNGKDDGVALPGPLANAIGTVR